MTTVKELTEETQVSLANNKNEAWDVLMCIWCTGEKMTYLGKGNTERVPLTSSARPYTCNSARKSKVKAMQKKKD